MRPALDKVRANGLDFTVEFSQAFAFDMSNNCGAPIDTAIDFIKFLLFMYVVRKSNF